MFKYRFDNKKFSFYFLSKLDVIVPIENWNELQSNYLSQIAILSELHDNGLAEYLDDACSVENAVILHLSDIDKQILNLPETYPYEIFIEPIGTLTHNTFKFKYGFYDFHPNGNRLNAKLDGATLAVNENLYLLSEKQYETCQNIDKFNDLTDDEKGNVVNLQALSKLKILSKERGIKLDNFLNSQELFIPEKITLNAHFDNGVLGISPAVEIENSVSFTNTFNKLPVVRDIYPVSGNDGTTTRVLFAENQKTELQKIKSLGKITDPAKIRDIVENHEQYFDSDIVDSKNLSTDEILNFYGARVTEIGIYSPKFYAFTSPYKSEWIPGIVVKDKVHGEKRIYFKTSDKLSYFIEQKDKAAKNGENILHWEGVDLPIEDAEKFIQIAKQQFKNPNTPVKSEKKSDNEVLIIKENAELTEFTNGIELPEQLQHKFSKINNLSEGISLKEHQKEGISWLQSLFKENLSGGLLADDMGLGKTLQLLYFIEWHSQHYNEDKPYLIVAPVSLLENWENEYKKFFNPQNLPLLKLYGSVSLTRGNEPRKNHKNAKDLQFRQIILTNYETVRSYQFSLGLVDFAIIALDEAQKIKTPGALVTNASKALKADFKIAMTGTPVENTLVDIWCIIDFAIPGLLGNAKDFAKEYQNPLQDENTNRKELTERLRGQIGIFIKRRLKKDVAKDLPNKYDNAKIRTVMPRAQLDRYKLEIERANDTSLKGIEGRNQILKSLWAVRDISDHPYLLENNFRNFSSDELISSSSKLQTTVGILADIRSKDEKVIIFADRRETQKMLQKVVYESFGTFPRIINGDTPTTKQHEGKANLSRQQTIDNFQDVSGFNIIIMSPIAAGVGLNVTQANHVIHYTRHWNPAKEEQATDRAYRIGQKKDVYVYYPMAIFPEEMKDENGNKLKSFDEVLDLLLNRKKALANDALFPTEEAEITPDELFGSIFGTTGK
ncbi:hypothetical protein Dfri01_67220 [Dyadobacter frigoris]|uniref:DEAD/DEAH box helicase n=1 Tax=Dyadobacter frigoris TaxID=2576211 RepID=UPI0024A41797|nr:DEAD/DEAH box helicase [Dyadobacter frigoris]GLU57261.1 hypothetical protein Dfri01_67220 [Dyadobacter frigoris]